MKGVAIQFCKSVEVRGSLWPLNLIKVRDCDHVRINVRINGMKKLGQSKMELLGL